MRAGFTPITYNTHVKQSLSKLAAVHNDYDYCLKVKTTDVVEHSSPQKNREK
ncbi:hypothetical protein XF_1364 [Xylella fastidiosa 9a5c]|uniref:Uncharacterized protein n=1 Tax=Xylella fastidiosa (strain 9a5c) TaxID=160492 RepID=Q9PDL5_XYLFA|nr:hypothetical protein XF_1364 [Xylella fastidiosa 9a5c]